MACLKHFPGQGEAGADTHAEATIIEASLETLMKRELQPYLAMMHECPMIMVSHAIYPALDAVYPASLSKHIMQDFLRQKLQYQGLVVTDDMNMKAIAQDKETWTTAVLNSVAAGADLVLVCRDLDRYRWAIEALARESERSPAFQNRLTDALQRLHSLRTRLSF
ncbi:MAG: hypothetical protein NTX25_16670 [Proteobacteria bacterium]|nr:hypothetical protein [Pseudomonadota bacterium]